MTPAEIPFSIQLLKIQEPCPPFQMVSLCNIFVIRYCYVSEVGVFFFVVFDWLKLKQAKRCRPLVQFLPWPMFSGYFLNPWLLVCCTRLYCTCQLLHWFSAESESLAVRKVMGKECSVLRQDRLWSSSERFAVRKDT